MNKLFRIIVSIFLLLSLSVGIESAGEASYAEPYRQEVSIADWQPSEGDFLTIDLNTNTGYITSFDEQLVAKFPLISGAKKTVSYIGLKYWAETPVGEWVVKDKVIKKDRKTFGKTGRFLRLLVNGEKFSHYGIHTYKNVENLLTLDEEKRYESMGCLLVSEETMNLLDKILEANKNEGLRVVTYRS